jgi:hypothetical protein
MTEMTKDIRKVLHCQPKSFIYTWAIIGCVFGFMFWNNLINFIRHI